MSTMAVAYSNLEPVERKLPWARFLVLTLAFLWPVRFDTAYPLEEELTVEQQVTLAEDGTPGRAIALLCLGAFAVASLIVHRGHGLRVQGPLAWAVLLYLGWAFLSATWTDELLLTARRLAVLAIFAVAAVDVAGRFTVREVVKFAVFLTSVYLGLSLFVELRSGTFRPLMPGYRFGGLMHPNGQGVNCGILLLAATTLARSEKGQRPVYWMVAAAALPFLLLTRSRAALAAAAFGMLVCWTRGLTGLRKLTLAVGFCFAASLALLVLPGEGVARMVFLDRDLDSVSTLTGRTPLWQECLSWAAHRPLLGYGYGSFWTTERIEEISSSQTWTTPDAHSAYLDILLAVGPVGVIAVILMLLLGMRRASLRRAETADAGYAFYYSLLAFCALHAVVESALKHPATLMFLALVACVQLGFKPLDTAPNAEAASPSELRQGDVR